MSESDGSVFNDTEASFEPESQESARAYRTDSDNPEPAWQSLLVKVTTVLAIWLGY